MALTPNLRKAWLRFFFKKGAVPLAILISPQRGLQGDVPYVIYVSQKILFRQKFRTVRLNIRGFIDNLKMAILTCVIYINNLNFKDYFK
jgi:hypothetical protein